MMVSFATATVPLKQLLPISPTIASPPRSIPSFSNNVLKSISTNPLSSIFGKLSSDKPVQSSRVFSLPGNQGFWEAPDDDSGSDYDDDEEEEGNNLDFESDWEEEEEEEGGGGGGGGERVSSDEQYEEDLRKEMEQLLEPEERDILWKNATPNLNRISTAKWNPLHSLALAGQIHHIDMLLENGLHVDLVDKDGLTALHTAVIGKKEPVVSHILRRGANPNVTDRDGASPLHYAVQVGAMQTVKLLIKYNVDLNAADKDGWTPLHIAIQSRNRDIAKVLLLNGADKTRRNKDGRTPLDLALCYGREFKSYDLAKLLKLVPAKRYEVVKNSEPKWHPVRVFKSDLPLPRSKSRGMLANSLYLEDFDSEAEAHLNKTGLDISRMGKFKRNVT